MILSLPRGAADPQPLLAVEIAEHRKAEVDGKVPIDFALVGIEAVA